MLTIYMDLPTLSYIIEKALEPGWSLSKLYTYLGDTIEYKVVVQPEQEPDRVGVTFFSDLDTLGSFVHEYLKEHPYDKIKLNFEPDTWKAYVDKNQGTTKLTDLVLSVPPDVQKEIFDYLEQEFDDKKIITA